MKTDIENWQFEEVETAGGMGIKYLTKPTYEYLGMDADDAASYHDAHTTVEYVRDDNDALITTDCSCGGRGRHDGGVCIHRYRTEWEDRRSRDELCPDDPQEWRDALGF